MKSLLNKNVLIVLFSVLGLVFLVLAVFLIHVIAGFAATGVACLIAGWWVEQNA